MNTDRGDLLVGSTGFVGGNLALQHAFALAVHSSDVARAYGMHPKLCVYAGVPSAMFLANGDPEADLSVMAAARENLRRIAPRKVVLVSTIAVYADSRGKDEASQPTSEGLAAYGVNRLQLEWWVREDFEDALILRLPALYGEGLKKNFVRDMITVAPPLLTGIKYAELAVDSPLIMSSYELRGDGFYALRPDADMRALRAWFEASEFNALSFTDSRSRFQFYGLRRLWGDICTALEGDWNVFNLATPPVSAAEVYWYIRGNRWVNELVGEPYDYDMKTLHSLDGSGYLSTKTDELDSLKAFVEACS